MGCVVFETVWFASPRGYFCPHADIASFQRVDDDAEDDLHSFSRRYFFSQYSAKVEECAPSRWSANCSYCNYLDKLENFRFLNLTSRKSISKAHLINTCNVPANKKLKRCGIEIIPIELLHAWKTERATTPGRTVRTPRRECGDVCHQPQERIHIWRHSRYIPSKGDSRRKRNRNKQPSVI